MAFFHVNQQYSSAIPDNRWHSSIVTMNFVNSHVFSVFACVSFLFLPLQAYKISFDVPYCVLFCVSKNWQQYYIEYTHGMMSKSTYKVESFLGYNIFELKKNLKKSILKYCAR